MMMALVLAFARIFFGKFDTVVFDAFDAVDHRDMDAVRADPLGMLFDLAGFDHSDLR
jgi:hypothetical protein